MNSDINSIHEPAGSASATSVTSWTDVTLDAGWRWFDQGLLNWSWSAILAFTLFMTHVTIASVTIYLHRAQSHRALTLGSLSSHFFRLWLWLTTGMGTREWVAIHRKHHAKCETQQDPHSPKVMGLRKVLLEGAELYRKESMNEDTLKRYGHGTPNDWIEINVYKRYTWQGLGLMLITDLALFGIIGLTVWAVQMLWIPIFAAGVINGIGHAKGYRNFDVPDAACNISPWGILIGGEELHNNHHTYPTSPKLSVKPYEFDIGWLYIKLLSFAGQAQPRAVPSALVVGPLREIDRSTVQAVIQQRNEIMARLALAIRNQARVEIRAIKTKRLNGQSSSIASNTGVTNVTDKNVQGAQTEVAGSWKADRRLLKAVARWIPKRRALMNPAQLQNLLVELHSRSSLTRVEMLVRMRDELGQVWSTTNASMDDAVQELKAWCQKAESSGLEALIQIARLVKRLEPNPKGALVPT